MAINYTKKIKELQNLTPELDKGVFFGVNPNANEKANLKKKYLYKASNNAVYQAEKYYNPTTNTIKYFNLEGGSRSTPEGWVKFNDYLSNLKGKQKMSEFYSDFVPEVGKEFTDFGGEKIKITKVDPTYKGGSGRIYYTRNGKQQEARTEDFYRNVFGGVVDRNQFYQSVLGKQAPKYYEKGNPAYIKDKKTGKIEKIGGGGYSQDYVDYLIKVRGGQQVDAQGNPIGEFQSGVGSEGLKAMGKQWEQEAKQRWEKTATLEDRAKSEAFKEEQLRQKAIAEGEIKPAPNEKIKMYNPITGKEFETTYEDYQKNFKSKGWTLEPSKKTTPEIPSEIDEEALIEGATPEAQQRAIDRKNVLNTYQTRPNAIANENFVNAAVNAALGRNASIDELGRGDDRFKLVGLSVGEVVEKLGLSDDFGVADQITPTEIATEDPAEVASETTAQLAMGPPSGATAGDVSQVTGMDYFQQTLVGLDAQTEQEIQNANKIKAELDKMAADMNYDEILSLAGAGERADKLEANLEEVKADDIDRAMEAGLMNNLITEYNATESRIDRAEALQKATNLYQYNLKQIDYQLAVGNVQAAQTRAQQTRQDMYNYHNMMMQEMQFNYNVARDKIEDMRYANEAFWERIGFGAIPISQEEYQTMLDKYGSKRVITDMSGKSWLLPVAETQRQVDFGVIGEDEYGNKIYGFIDKDNQKIIPIGENPMPGNFNDPNASGVITDASGTSYNITSYATDPNHEIAVQSILNKIGKMSNIEQMDNYIQSVAPGSPITGQMIANASKKYGVSWETMMAIMQQDSAFGTAGKGARTYNPGNVGNVDSGAEVNYGDWQSGVDAVAKNLAWRKVVPKGIDATIQSYVDLVKRGELTSKEALEKVPTGKKRDELSKALSDVQTYAQTNKDIALADKVNQILALKEHPGLNSSVGPVHGTRIAFVDQFGNKDDFLGKVDQLISNFSLENLIQSKAEGATFGALSENELRMLSSAATTLGAWAVKDKNNKIKYFDAPEKSFKEELQNMANIINNRIKNEEKKVNFQQFYNPLNLDLNINNSTNSLGI